MAYRIRLVAAGVLAVAAAAACVGETSGQDPSLGELFDDDGTQSVSASGEDADGGDDSPLILEYPKAGEGGAGDVVDYLASDAEPSTALGRLRARYFPVWSNDLDWGFPPQVCDSAWELDAISARDVFADTSILGDPAIAVARSVMRYEYLYSRALGDPTALGQLCVAVGSMNPIRAKNLLVLKSFLDEGGHRTQAAGYPDQVTVLALGGGSAVAVACVESSYPGSLDAGNSTDGPVLALARLQAYRLSVARGLEDTVTDTSYRVSDTVHEPVDDCRGLDDYAQRWTEQISEWIDEGQIWTLVDKVIDVVAVCQPSQGFDKPDCPTDWPV